jgi:hypothetical protein
MIEDIDYRYVFPAKDDKSVHIKLLTGPFEGTIFKYGKVKVEERDGQGYLLFDYDVIESKVSKPKKLIKNEDFKNCIGGLLVEIISGNIEQEIIDENGTTNLEESDSE